MDSAGARDLFAGAVEAAAAANGAPDSKRQKWWPGTQGEATTLSWSLALEWSKKSGHGKRQPWYCSTWGQTHSKAAKASLLKRYGIRFADDGGDPAGGGRRFSAHEAMLDFVVFPARPQGGAECALLTMESEVYPRHGVKGDVDGDNDYAWDFFKLLWVPAPRRLFVARVGTRDGVPGSRRRETLQASLDALTAEYRGLVHDAELVVFILGEARRDMVDSSAGIWNGEGFDWEPVFAEK